MADSPARYGYEAGWIDARAMVYEAMTESRKRDPDGPWPILYSLWESMDGDARERKSETYMAELRA